MTVIVPPPPGATTRALVISAPCRPSCCLGGGTPKCSQGRLEPLNSLLQRVCVWRRRRRCSPFVGIHITDQRFWLALGYCPLLPGHLHGRVNTAAQRLTTSHPKLTQLSPPPPPSTRVARISYTAHALPRRCRPVAACRGPESQERFESRSPEVRVWTFDLLDKRVGDTL